MEFTLDVALVREILRRERALATDEIGTDGPVAALGRASLRHEARIGDAPDVATLACQPGCAWCCYFTVDVRPVEVFAILDHVERSLTANEQARVYAEIRETSARVRAFGNEARFTQNIKCPFLHDGRCVIYAARPQSCRNYHATSVAGCRQSFEAPEDLAIDPEFAPGVYQAGSAHVEAFTAAMRERGYDVDAYELSTAFDSALSLPGARERFEARLRPFPGLDGDVVTPEFDDLDND